MKTALLVAAFLLAATAEGQLPPPRDQPNPLHSFFPTASALHTQRSQALERAVERSLAALPNVTAAHVTTRLPSLDQAAIDAPLPPPRAHVLLEVTASGPTDEVVRAQIRALAPELGEQLTVQRVASSSPDQRNAALVSVGPFTVAAHSAPALRSLIALCLCANALMSGLLLWRWRRGR